MYDWGFILMLPAFLGLSFLTVWLISRTTSRNGAPTRRFSGVQVATVIGLTAVMILAWSYLAPSLPQTSFVKRRWASLPWRRASMVEDVMASRLHAGMTAAQVRALLGDGNGSYDSGNSWVIWRPRDVFALIDPELVVQYDKSGRVKRYFIAQGLID